MLCSDHTNSRDRNWHRGKSTLDDATAAIRDSLRAFVIKLETMLGH